MLPSNEHYLIDYLDNRLEGEERLKAETLIREDAAAAKELENLRFSVELIREAGVLEQVTAVRTAFNAAAKIVPMQQKEAGATVRSFSKNMLRIAATVLLLVGAATLYKYSTTSAAGVYDQQFASFDLNTSRGSNNDGELEKAYRSKNWTAVENIFATQKEKTAKSWFLAGMADMELKNYNAAIPAFREVANINRNNAEPRFQDESEYYLALSYLGARQPAEGIAILKKIRDDKEHLFYKKALAIPALDLKLLELKN